MEEVDKKKKRNNKKKKSKLLKSTDDLPSAADDHNASSNGNHQQHIDPAPQNGAPRNHDFDTHPHKISALTEAEKQQWLQREAVLKGTIRQLQNDNDSHAQNEAVLEEKLKLLQVENDSVRQKQASLEDIINQLRITNDSTLQQEVELKEKITQLKNEIDLHRQKEAVLEKKIVQFQSETELCYRKEAGLEEKLQHLVNEKIILGIKVANLEDKIKLLENDKDSLTITETAGREKIAGMNVDITRLGMQVVEFEESRNSLIKENQQLKKSMLDLQLQIQNLEMRVASTNTSDEMKKHASEAEDKDSQIEAACALIDKLITENAELIEKVNELYIKLDRQRSTAGLSSFAGSDDMVGSTEITSENVSVPESGEYIVDYKLESSEIESAVEDDSVTVVVGESGEIVQIPLDDNMPPDLEVQARENDDKLQAVPLSEAPLTGAPLRLISFFAKYVSGADLVDNN
ncbi:Mitochondrial ATP synthase D chain-related protein [Euphorbia peplus]|nr:Mitochondrial ATP synthase D chain-related protein [Euphorbia peplus]